MSKIPGLRFMLKRQGEKGKIGPLKDAVQMFSDSGMMLAFTKAGYYECGVEEWELATGLKAGDMDNDGDYDVTDRRLAERLKKTVIGRNKVRRVGAKKVE